MSATTTSWDSQTLTPKPLNQSSAQPQLTVLCLCAAWCGVCRQYEPDFLALRQQFPQLRFAWVDVEDEEDLIGDVDVETFPTLLIASDQQALFFGPLLPQIKVLERLVDTLLQEPKPVAGLPLEAQALWLRMAKKWH